MRKGLLVFLFCLFLQWNLAPPVCAAGRLRVGVHDNQPLAFVDADGQAKGFIIDILEYIGAKEGWRIDYIPGSLTECLERLRKGEIDLAVGIEYSRESNEVYDFSY